MRPLEFFWKSAVTAAAVSWTGMFARNGAYQLEQKGILPSWHTTPIDGHPELTTHLHDFVAMGAGIATALLLSYILTRRGPQYPVLQ